MITLHGTLDALLPIGESSEIYRDLVEAAGRSHLHSYFVIEGGNHVDGFYPHPQTLERLQKTGAQVFRNDEHGDVIVSTDGEKADVAVTKEA
jgi:fermentation-respiration switch protein FrsA (DUF1100 family)